MAAAATELLYCYKGRGGGPTTALSKTLSLVSSPFPKSILHLLRSAPSSLCLHHRSISRLAANPHHISITNEDDGEEELELETEPNGDESDLDFDVDALEHDALLTVQEFSSSLSHQLTIEDEVTDEKIRSRKQRRQRSQVKIKSIPDHLLPRVAIVGRPNVGKSALFNRLVSGNKAIVVNEPGVTRDRLYGRSFWGDFEFMVVDTGGVLTVSKSQANVMEELAISTTVGMDGIPLASRDAAVARMPLMIEKQATAAVEESSVIIFLVDGQAGLTAADEEISDWLRRNYSDKYVILAVNKCESPRKGVMQASEFWSLGWSTEKWYSLNSPLSLTKLIEGEKMRWVDSERHKTLLSEKHKGRGRGTSEIFEDYKGWGRAIDVFKLVSGATRDASYNTVRNCQFC